MGGSATNADRKVSSTFGDTVKYPLKVYVWYAAWRLGFKYWAKEKATRWSRIERAKNEHRVFAETEYGFLDRKKRIYDLRCQDEPDFRESESGKKMSREISKLAFELDLYYGSDPVLPEDLPKAVLKKK